MRRLRLHILTLCGLVAVSAASPAVGAPITGPEVISRADKGGNPSAPADVGGVSADGRRVAVISADSLAGTVVGIRQLYVRDIPSGRTLLVSRTRDGRPADAAVDVPPSGAGGAALSADGRFAVFTSRAGKLVADDPDGGMRDVFRADLATGDIRLVSASADGAPSTFDVDPVADISADGARVAYVRTRGGTSELVVADLLRGGEAIASIGGGGAPLPGPFGAPSLSADGRVVAFSSGGHIYVRTLDDAVATDLGPGTRPSLSGNGSVVAYADGTSILRRDIAFGVTTTIPSNGVDPVISADGNRIAWTSTVDSAPGDTNGLPDVYVITLPGGSIQRAIPGPASVPRASTTPSLSADGSRLVFELDDGPAPSRSPAPGDTDLARDVLGVAMPPVDAAGPAIQASVNADATPAPVVTVSGRVTDGSGVAYVLVRGLRARVDRNGAFAVTLSLAGGSNVIPVRAMDGAGNVSTTSVVVSHTLLTRLGLGVVPRATGLAIARSGRRTIIRFRLDRSATRVWVVLARRERTASGGTRYTPVGPARRLSGTAGVRGGLLSPKALARGIYQVRVTVVSPQGTRVVAHRFVVSAPPRPPKRVTPKRVTPKKTTPVTTTPKR